MLYQHNLNRLVGEDANDSNDTHGYLVSYEYDIVGNRIQRTVDCNGDNLTTTYDFNDVNDLLIKETHVGPVAAMNYENFRVYAYATDHGIRYTMAGHDGYIGRIKAYFMGLPSEWSMYLFYAALILVPLVFLTPAIGHFTARFRRKDKDKKRGVLRLSLYHRCMSVMLAYMILLGPVGLHELSQGATLYQGIGVNDWNSSGQDVDIHYDYDENGSVVEKITAVINEADPDTNYLEKVTYEYNLQNRLSKVTTNTAADVDTDGLDDDWLITEVVYKYNSSGSRVQSNWLCSGSGGMDARSGSSGCDLHDWRRHHKPVEFHRRRRYYPKGFGGSKYAG